MGRLRQIRPIKKRRRHAKPLISSFAWRNKKIKVFNDKSLSVATVR
jgi:hypothetical protein